MITVSRKQVENYYEEEWADIISQKTTNLLIELTCRSYHLNCPSIPNFVKQQEILKPQNLGQV